MELIEEKLLLSHSITYDTLYGVSCLRMENRSPLERVILQLGDRCQYCRRACLHGRSR